MKAHALIFNNRVFVVLENMHKEVYIITDKSEMQVNWPYEQTVTRLENGAVDARNPYMVHDY